MKRRNFQSLLVAGQLVAQLVHALSADNNLVPRHLWWRKTRPKPENVSMFCARLWHYFVDNKVKGRISKQMLRENKLRQIYRKTNISYPLISTLACAYQGVRNIYFSEIWCALFFLQHSFWGSHFCLITDNFWSH